MFGGRTSLVIAVMNILVYAGITLVQDQGWIPVNIENNPFTAIGLTSVSMLLLALVTWQAVQNLQLYIQRLQERERVQQDMSAEKDRLLEELQQREEARHHLLETVRALGSPVIPLAEGVIAMPLIGAIDSERAAGLTQALLWGVAEYRARAVLVDITSVPLVDAEVAGALIRAMTGVRLLGAEPVLTGIRAEVAQTIVGLGLDLSGMMTMGSLQEGLSYVMGQAGPKRG
jgi:anti-anti-sigma regulatory factor